PRDARRGRTTLPVTSPPRPQKGLEAEGANAPEPAEREDAVRGTVEPRPWPSSLVDRVEGAPGVVGEEPPCPLAPRLVAVPVHADLVARCGDFTHELGIALDLPADHEEDRGSAGASERPENGRGAQP